MGYENNALGLWVNGDTLVTAEQLSGRNFLIAKYGTYFHKNVQAAYDVKIPCLLFYEGNPELLFESGYNNAEWDDAINVDLQNILEAIGSRVVHGVVIDCKVKDSLEKLIEANWVAGYTKRLLTRSNEILGIPSFHYMAPGVPGMYSGNDKEIINQFIIGCKTISTWSATTSIDGFPADGTKPALPYDDSTLCPWAFWLFAANSGKFDVLYNGDVAALYAKLKYITATSTETTV
jgi:hypothetical protein